ncbi:TIGR03943 family protein [Robertmurraya yapensis]|uniref:TIGR03943 family protein n=1 Tax=Bacillus yapensis TaxID=2492960 RepID=A0A3S0L9Z6_9BACI|nr:TIGR03943 family protein [Bacillus yapensis]RTR30511.1 TIGR03943 family protein [Bacillus yapensis]TKS95330.1 TIGR03943 family protein [Bacillus yapensis]
MVRTRFQHFFKAILLLAFDLFFIKLHTTGDISKYINPKYENMSFLAIWIFTLLFLIQLFRIWENNRDEHAYCPPGCNHDHGDSASVPRKLVNYSIILFPLVTGFALSPTVLDASIAANKGTVLPQSNSNSYDEDLLEYEFGDEEEIVNDNFLSNQEYDDKMKNLEQTEFIEMKEDIFASYYEFISDTPEKFQGKKIKVQGFVYKEEGMKGNQLVLSRFLITHCIADASIIGLMAEFEQATEYPEDTWLELEGTLDVMNYNGVKIPVIKAVKWTVIEEPASPYIYPVLTKIL